MTTRWVIWSDVHIPFANPVATELTLRFLDWYKPNVAILAGDLLDFYMLSSFDRDPRRRMTIDQDLAATNAYLDAVDRVLPADCEKVFVEGNHDDRLRRFLWHRAPELVPLNTLTLPGLLRLAERRWGYIPYYDPVNTSGAPGFYRSGILVMHGIFARRWSGQSAKAHFDRFGGNGVHGHTHRLGVFQHRYFGDNGQHIWYEAGCQCSLEPSYMPGPDWQNGLVAGRVWEDGGNPYPRFDFSLGQIHNGKLTWEGQMFRA